MSIKLQRQAYATGEQALCLMPGELIPYHDNLFRGHSLFRNKRLKINKPAPGKVSAFVKIIGQVIAIAIGLSVLMVICLRWVPPPTSAFMLKRHIDNLFAGKNRVDIRYDWVKLKSVSPQVPLAVIAAEDQKFPHHYGFDLESISKAMEYNKKGGRLRGASTITQQTAKNLFLWSGRSYLRKGLEAYFTVLLEIFWSKERILEVYINIAEFGNGIYGVSAAAEKFFGKRPSRLTRRDAAWLAAVLPNPRQMKVRKPSFQVKERKRWIEGQMEHLGVAYLNLL